MDELVKLKEGDPNAMLTPQEYFDAMKDKKNTVTSEDLKKIYDNCMELANKYRITGQIRGLRKILFCMESIEKEAAMCGQKKGKAPIEGEDFDGDGSPDDPMLKNAVELAVETGKISTSLIQRRLSLGYGRAAKLIDRMEQMGYVSAPEGQKPRRVLITKEQYMELVLKQEDII